MALSGCKAEAGDTPAGGGTTPAAAPARGGDRAFRTVTNVEVVRVARGAVASYQVANGNLEAIRRAPVYARNAEICTEVLARENDPVKKGDVLARLASARFQNALDRAQAAVDRSVQREREADIASQKAHADYQRLLELVKEGIDGIYIAKDEIDRARVESEKAKVQLEAAKADQLSALSDLRNSRLDLDNCTVRAPIDGMVTIRKIEPNELVKVDQELFQVAELGTLRLRAELPETAITSLRDPPRSPEGNEHDADISKCQAVLLAGTAFPGERFLGYVEMVSQVVTDPTRGMFSVHVRVLQPADADSPEYAPLLLQFPPAEREALLATTRRAKDAAESLKPLRLRPGNFLEASIVTDFHQDVLVIPASCIVDADRAVFVIQEDAAHTEMTDAKPAPAGDTAPKPTAENGGRKRPEGGGGRPEGGGTGGGTGSGPAGPARGDSASPERTVNRISLAGHIGMTSEGYAEILPSAPVKLGDRVVFRGQDYLKDKAPVRIVTPPKS